MKDKKEIKKDKSSKLNIEELEQKCGEYLAGWQRAQADYDNLKKETDKAKTEWIKMANGDLLAEILPVYDNLKLAIVHIPEEQKKLDWVVGIEHIKNQLSNFLEQNGVEEIKTVGEEFDPKVHEAVASHESIKTLKHESNKVDEDETRLRQGFGGRRDNIIKKEVRAGYKLHGKVLYSAKVIV